MSKKKNAGKISPKSAADSIRSLINKQAGFNASFNLNDHSPTEVKEWIPTGSRWLDSVICKGQLAGIPVGKITEIAGLEATGKSFLAAQIAANAQKMNKLVVYFDSESSIDPEFWRKAGIDIDNMIYVQALHVEFVMEKVQEILAATTEEKVVFIWDSLALTPTNKDIEGDFNPNSSIGVKARILSKAFQKLTIPLANAEATFIILNQLKTNITTSPSEAMVNPYVTPGGKTIDYTASLRIWLTGRKSKASRLLDEKGFQIGSEVKCTLKKSRWGTQNRNCTFKILWGNEVGVQDKESWLEAIKSSDHIRQSGAWYSLVYQDGTEEKFQGKNWIEKLENEKFHSRVLQVMDEEVIEKFHNRTGNAEDFYDSDSSND